MTLRTLLLGGLALLVGAQATAQIEPKIRLVFSETDAGEVLRIIGSRTGANIVYGVKDKIPVTLNIAVSTTEEAVRSTVSAAGLAYKRVALTYVVAKPEDLRKAVHPYTMRVQLPIQFIDAATLVKQIEDAFPAVSAHAATNLVHVDAVPTDLAEVRRFVQEQDRAVGPQRREVVSLKYISPIQAGQMITSMYPNLKVSTIAAQDATHGDLGIYGSKRDVDEAVEVLRRIDRQQFGPEGESVFRLYETKYASPVVLQKFLSEALPTVKATVGPESYTPMEPAFRTMGLGQSSGSSGGGGGGGANAGAGGQAGGQAGGGGASGSIFQPYQQVKEGDRAKTLLLEGSAALVDRALRLLNEYDVKPKQVWVEVKVVDTSPEVLTSAGVDYTWSPFNFSEVAPGGTPGSTTTRPVGLGEFSRKRLDFTAVLSALITKKEARILAKPNVQVIDNDDAFIFIGDTIRVKLTSTTGLGGQTIQIEEFPIGIILLIRPRVNVDGNITMRVHPIVSSISTIGSDGLPQSTSREAETTLILKDGETVVIGGLIKDDMRKTVREIPILGQIPILGELFKSRTTDHRRSDIVLFITTHIVDDSKESNMGNPPPAKNEKKGGS